MSDLESEVGIREQLNDAIDKAAPDPDWRGEIPFLRESVPGGAAEIFAKLVADGTPRDIATSVADASIMNEGEWLGCWKIDMATGGLVTR